MKTREIITQTMAEYGESPADYALDPAVILAEDFEEELERRAEALTQYVLEMFDS